MRDILHICTVMLACTAAFALDVPSSGMRGIGTVSTVQPGLSRFRDPMGYSGEHLRNMHVASHQRLISPWKAALSAPYASRRFLFLAAVTPRG